MKKINLILTLFFSLIVTLTMAVAEEGGGGPIVCPGSGAVCTIKKSTLLGDITINSEKDKNGGSIIIQS